MKLRVTPAEGDPYDFELNDDAIIVGRSSTADLALSDPFLSRHHARLSREGEVLKVEDLGSRNGTFINDAKVEGKAVVNSGDVIRLSASSIALAGDRASIASVTTRDTDIGATIFRPASELLEEDISSSTDLLDSAEALRKYAQRLEILRDVHEAVAGSMDEQELFDLILDRVFDHLKPQQGVIWLRGEDGQFYQAATRALPGQSTDIPLSTTLVSEVTTKGMAALVFDASTDDRFSASESIMMSGIRSMVAAPMLDPEAGALGMIVLNSKVAVRQFAEEDMELLTSLASVAALKHRNIALTEEAVRRRQLQAEVDLARQIQLDLLPDELPRFEGYEILGRNIPHSGVSGDYYVVVPRNEGTECVFFLADVSGKGIAASLVTASLEALAAEPIESGEPTDAICRKLCRRLYARTPANKYATAFAAVLEPESGRLSYTNAGHNTALLVHADGSVEELEACGLPIALLPESDYERRDTEMRPGSTMIVYSDGITEAENREQDEYGLDRLRELVVANRHRAVDEIADAIDDDLARFVGSTPYSDDRTLLLLQRPPA
ncbi:MAG: SpoIIE family protein phosphatase [Thermoanaerobaculia bacterium]|nr:SpoIIE family protein phosphatase [Thermoanaerobaculia bacterium]